jgi:hypothetical protein
VRLRCEPRAGPLPVLTAVHPVDPHERVTFRDGAGEATGLAAASVDLVICAQAFHWMRWARARAQVRLARCDVA